MEHCILQRAYGTKRCHTVPIIGTYNLAEHQWGVAQLCRLLWPGYTDQEVLELALDHDMPEVVFGDAPAPAKSARSAECTLEMEAAEDGWAEQHGFKHERGVAERTYLMVKCADYLELMMFCVRQRRLGNTCVYDMFLTAVRLVDAFAARLVDNSMGDSPRALMAQLVKDYADVR